MNVPTPVLPTRDTTTPAPRRTNRRERSFGTGYGRSSGYASKRESYVRSWRPGSFRVG